MKFKYSEIRESVIFPITAIFVFALTVGMFGWVEGIKIALLCFGFTAVIWFFMKRLDKLNQRSISKKKE